MKTNDDIHKAAVDALNGKRNDVYPCREDVPPELWGKKIEGKIYVPDTNTSEYERGYGKGFIDGFQTARADPNLIFPNVAPSKNPNSIRTTNNMCHVCGVQITNVFGSYICSQEGCPSRITASVSIGAVGAEYNLNTGDKND